MRTIVVVGGGIAGLVAALELGRSARVVLVEREAAPGGLLRSTRNRLGHAFDHGTHVLSDTGVPALDERLFGRLDGHTWNRFAVIRAGTFLRGRLWPDSVFPDARALPPALHARAARELLAAAASAPEASRDLAEFAARRFGPTIAEHVLAPVMRKQFPATTMSEMAADNPFLPRRVVAFGPEEARRRKRDPRVDDVVAFASNAEGAGTPRHHYPREGGVGRWVEGLVAELAAEGVELRCGRSVQRVAAAGGRATAVTLDDGATLPVDHLVWTVPPGLLLKALGAEAAAAPVAARPVGLFHLAFDRPFLVDNHYVTCYDEAYRTFRVTMYPNLREDGGKGGHNATVEVVLAPGEDAHALAPAVRSELSRMGLVEEAARALAVDVDVVPSGFPPLTHGFLAAVAEQQAAALRRASNVTLLGRAKTRPFFMDEVLREAHAEARRIREEVAA